MSAARSFKQKLAQIHRLWDQEDFEGAFSEVERLSKDWPGNPHLLLVRASLIQLREDANESLDDAKSALRQAIDLDKASPASLIEFGHFLDSVEDDAHAAAKVFADAADTARRMLIESLEGQAKALLQLNKRSDAWNCIEQALRLEHEVRRRRPKTMDEYVSESLRELMTECVSVS